MYLPFTKHEINNPERAFSGVYSIVHLGSGKAYIGSAVCVRDRIKTHYSALQLGKHHSVLLQRAWDKYGPEAFGFRVIEYCDADSLIDREQSHLDQHESYNPERGYNVCQRAGSRLGVKHPDYVRAIISERSKVIASSPEFKARRRELMTGNTYGAHPHTEEFKQKRRAHMLGNTVNAGRKLTEAEIQTIIDRNKGNQYTKGRVMPDHEKEIRSAANKGKPKSPETRERMRQAALNRSAEHRANISKALRSKYGTV